MTLATHKQMKKTMLDAMATSLGKTRDHARLLEAIDRNLSEDYDLVDQMVTFDNLMSQMDELLARMNKVVGE